ncbi:MAG TPA: S41 family peptidase [Chryseosolibacter sp.]
MKSLIKIFLLSSVIVLASCSDELIGTEKPNTPVENFEYFWKTLDSRYGLFEVKKIDWQHVYDSYRPLVTEATTDAELYEIFKQMVNLLNDNHVNLYPTNGALPAYPGGLLRTRNGITEITKVQEDYDAEVVKKYLGNYKQRTWNLATGMLSDDVGYLSVKGTDSRKEVSERMNDIIDEFANAKAVVVDIRGFYGGSDAVSQLLAGHFANTTKLYMTTRKRNGPKHSDFTEPESWYVSPQGKSQFTKPVIVLTSRFSQSAAETFALAMNELENVTLLGDTTAGGYSDNPTTEMYNGWMFSFSVGDFRAADGKSYEGIGTAPDVRMVNRKEDLLSGRDPVLEKAIELLTK